MYYCKFSKLMIHKHSRSPLQFFKKIFVWKLFVVRCLGCRRIFFCVVFNCFELGMKFDVLKCVCARAEIFRKRISLSAEQEKFLCSNRNWIYILKYFPKWNSALSLILLWSIKIGTTKVFDLSDF